MMANILSQSQSGDFQAMNFILIRHLQGFKVHLEFHDIPSYMPFYSETKLLESEN
jgi:hypothetical protein